MVNDTNYGENEMLYFFREHKGHEGLKGTPVEQYQQTLVHDHDKTYYNYGADHQECPVQCECNAHVASGFFV